MSDHCQSCQQAIDPDVAEWITTSGRRWLCDICVLPIIRAGDTFCIPANVKNWGESDEVDGISCREWVVRRLLRFPPWVAIEFAAAIVTFHGTLALDDLAYLMETTNPNPVTTERQ